MLPLLSLALGVLLAAPAFPEDPPPAASTALQAPRIDALAWLAGCWTRDTATRRVEEHWMKPAGGTMFGMSRTVASGKTAESEFLELREDGEGLVYIARPSNQTRAEFRWVSGSATSARFENPEHDFPQVITYTLKPDGSLIARIEGTVNGAPRAVDFPMQRGGC